MSICRLARNFSNFRSRHVYDSSQFILLLLHEDSDRTNVNIRSNTSQNEIQVRGYYLIDYSLSYIINI